MPSCVVKCCKNYLGKLKAQGVTYHKFPREKSRRDEWVKIIRNCRQQNDWNPSPSSTICSAHFDDNDFIKSAKGMRNLVSYAIPIRFLFKATGGQTERTFSPIQQMSPITGANNETPTSSSSTISSLTRALTPINEFKSNGYCRLCASSICDGTLVNIESDNAMKELVVNMLNRLNTNIDFRQEHLPTTVCSACIKSLYTSYDFVVGINLAQTTLTKISMQEHINQMPDQNIDESDVNLNQDIKVSLNTIKTEQPNTPEACDFDQPMPDVSSKACSQPLSPKIEAVAENYLVPLSPDMILSLATRRQRRLIDPLHKKKMIIDQQKKKIKTLNQKIRRFKKRNEKLKNLVKKLNEKNITDPDLYTLHENFVAANQLNNNLTTNDITDTE